MKLLKIAYIWILFCARLCLAQNEEFVVSPAPPHDTLYKLQRQDASTYSFSGLVKTISGQLIPTTVTLINQETFAENSFTTTDQNNAFTISDVPEGKYILRGTPLYFDYKTTYFNNTENPSNAFVFTLNGNISAVQLFLIQGTITNSYDAEYSNVQCNLASPQRFSEILEVHNTGTKASVYNSTGTEFSSLTGGLTVIQTVVWPQGLYFVRFEDGTVQKCIKE